MAVTTDPTGAAIGDEQRHRRLGLDLPAGWWPTTARVKGWEAAGFGHVQITIAARELLSDLGLLEAHAAALRASLRLTGMRLILHVPDNLLPGARRDDAELAHIAADRAGRDLAEMIEPLFAPHPAPLVLEVHPAQRPVPATLAVVMCELLGLGAPQVLGLWAATDAVTGGRRDPAIAPDR